MHMSDMSSKSAFLWLSCSQLLFPLKPFVSRSWSQALLALKSQLHHPIHCSSAALCPRLWNVWNFNPWRLWCHPALLWKPPDKALSWKQIKSRKWLKKKGKKKIKSWTKLDTAAISRHAWIEVWKTGTAQVLVCDQVVARISYSVSCWQCLLY